MSEFSQDNRPVAAEVMQPFASLVQADNEALALNANIHPSAAVESDDALNERSPVRLTDPARAGAETKSAATSSAESSAQSTGEVNKASLRLPVPPLTTRGQETAELYTEIKQRIAHRTGLPDDGSALAAFW